MRIGLFGGTFNPIHRGHLHIANEILATFPLDGVYLIPCANPPHKETKGLADAFDRLEMIRLALADCKFLRVSDVELRRNGPSYSIDTINYFHSRHSNGQELFLLVGLDAFLEFDTWKHYQEILETIALIVLPRPLTERGVKYGGRAALTEIIQKKLSRSYHFDNARSAYLHPELMPIYNPANLSPLQISSTQVRRQINKGFPINELVPQKVANYINAKGLYQ